MLNIYIIGVILVYRDPTVCVCYFEQVWMWLMWLVVSALLAGHVGYMPWFHACIYHLIYFVMFVSNSWCTKYIQFTIFCNQSKMHITFGPICSGAFVHLRNVPNPSLSREAHRSEPERVWRAFCVYHDRKFDTVDQLKQAIVMEWSAVLQRFIDHSTG